MDTQINVGPDKGSAFYKVTLNRSDDTGMIFLTSDDIPELFVAIKDESEIRSALDRVLKVAFEGKGDAQVYTNGSIVGPKIKTIVSVT